MLMGGFEPPSSQYYREHHIRTLCMRDVLPTELPELSLSIQSFLLYQSTRTGSPSPRQSYYIRQVPRGVQKDRVYPYQALMGGVEPAVSPKTYT